MVSDGEALLTQLRALGAFDHSGWASEAAQAEDLADYCPGVWIQPGEVNRASAAGDGRHIKTTRTWLVVITYAGDGRTPLETDAGPLADGVRRTLTGLKVGDQKPQRQLHYVGEVEPFYAPGYIELPLEFELTETFTGDDS